MKGGEPFRLRRNVKAKLLGNKNRNGASDHIGGIEQKCAARNAKKLAVGGVGLERKAKKHKLVT